MPTIDEKAGYDFLGWFRDDEAATPDTIVTSNMTYTSSWQGRQYTITFTDPKGFTDDMQMTATQGQRLGTLPQPTGVGYEFYGWATVDGHPVDQNSIFDWAKDITLEARLNANKYTIIYDRRGA